ncbi:hypothetical protein KIN20_019269 [Parelaphostrongylus tenuis]|uniref:Uncharacterized protein n=1 Tax=Parelaphostrongylus tenuis TaxID=148309 RepID=A0AAD5MKR7_PARTN|nr:hypothetical protein KIN20_019269 [Parelaphostrongylus tenuis]
MDFSLHDFHHPFPLVRNWEMKDSQARTTHVRKEANISASSTAVRDVGISAMESMVVTMENFFTAVLIVVA